MTRRLPLVTTVLIAIQMVMGGIIVGKDAGFVCPDWPLCYGQVMPKSTGLVLLELTHRFSALLVTVFVSATLIQVFRKHRNNRWMVRTAVAALGSLLVQCIVGGLIVLMKLPGVVTTIDVMNSMFLLALFVHLTILAASTESASTPLGDAKLLSLADPMRALFGATTLAVFVGALFRHTGASQALFGQDSYLLSHGQHTPPSLSASEVMLTVHIVTGLLVVGTSLWYVIATAQAGKRVWHSVLTFALVVLQAILGALSLMTKLGFVVSTAHWGNAALLVAVVAYGFSTVWLARQRQARVLHGTHRVMPEPGTVG